MGILKRIESLLEGETEASSQELSELAGAVRDELASLKFNRGQGISTLNRLATDGASDAEIRTTADDLAQVCGDLWRLQSVLPKLEAKLAEAKDRAAV